MERKVRANAGGTSGSFSQTRERDSIMRNYHVLVNFLGVSGDFSALVFRHLLIEKKFITPQFSVSIIQSDMYLPNAATTLSPDSSGFHLS